MPEHPPPQLLLDEVWLICTPQAQDMCQLTCLSEQRDRAIGFSSRLAVKVPAGHQYLEQRRLLTYVMSVQI
jgi:hypothetical protein